MHEREIDLETRDGRMPVFITHPEEGGPHPTVIFFMDALGIREELRDMARRIGTVGYYVMLANLFYREGGASFEPTPRPGASPNALPPWSRCTRASRSPTGPIPRTS